MKSFLAMFAYLAASSARCHAALFLRNSWNGPCRPRSLILVQCYQYSYQYRSRNFARHGSEFRQASKLLLNTRSPLSDLPGDPRERAFHAFSMLAKRDRSWQRFRHMVDLAVDHQQNDSRSIRSITDVGTDHGLLAVGLALSGRFGSVLGVDVSPNALKNGGFQVLGKIQEVLLSSDNDASPSMVSSNKYLSNLSSLPLAFRLSDGLRGVQPGEADAVCIAGMGVKVMDSILQASSDTVLELDRLNCQQLILQPTNSRPRNLIQLYDMLQGSGWVLLDERIEFLSRRWYLSSCFARSTTSSNSATSAENQEITKLPTSKLALRGDEDAMKVVTRDYWQHHLNWIQNEEEVSRGNLHKDDMQWREWVLQTLQG
mmetsp:Transcript_125910/g.352550  ORF Transcript_125910/g.352550 Transcript_125910/m.352550 type:complete len:372 (+) Transcript_125910:61-1176(+)